MRPVSRLGRQVLPVVIGLVLFLAALGVLRTELRALSWQGLIADMLATPRWRLGLALLLTFLNYALLTGYDFLALASIGKRLPRSHVAATSFLSYAIANNVGLAMLSGASVRYRFYTRWGVTASELTRIVFSYSVTFWLGLLALGGVSLAVHPFPAGHGFPDHRVAALVGWLLLLVSAAYLVATMVRRRPIDIHGLELSLPPPRLAAVQLVISTVEWALAGAVMYALLPPSQLSFLEFSGAFLAAILIGLASYIPGGLGVFEGTMVLLLKPYFASGELVRTFVLYRVVYYLLPLTIAMVALAVDEARQRRGQIARLGMRFAPIGRLVEQLTPRALSILTFLGGVLLLVSGATPAAPGRLSTLHGALPLAVIEISHFLGSIVGAALLVLSHGLKRRLDAAYFLAVTAVAIGIAVSLLKGADYEEATLLTCVLLVLWRARPAFDRRAAFFETRFSAAWIVAVVGAAGASVWLGMFAFRHVEYSRELWWQFELHAEASRFLRASVGVATGLLLFAMARLVGAAPHELVRPDSADLEAARAIIAAQGSTTANLVFLRDKAMLFDEDRTGFVMYGVQGRTWVALGDPVCPPDRVRGLIRRFLERCGDFGGVPVFYEVGTDYLHHYADFGLTFAKVGEEARVDLTAFTLHGARASKHRQLTRRLEKDGGVFRIIPAAEVPAVLEQLRAVSDDWLNEKSVAEKGFSLGFFDAEYLSRFPIAVVERGGRIEAFANLWLDEIGTSLSPDLMRYRHDAPRDVMEALFVHMMQWGKEQGYHWFALGMAPLSGFETSPVATLWNRLGALLFRHGEAFYNFQGLRAYKEKFNPLWTPRYLAYPGGLKLPRILVDASALIAGGYRSIFKPAVESGIRSLEFGMRGRMPNS
jgi:phosphatidylglycerol lysyltransferase